MTYKNTSAVQFPKNLKLDVKQDLGIEVRYNRAIRLILKPAFLSPLPAALEEIAKQTLSSYLDKWKDYRPHFQQKYAAMCPVSPIEDEILSLFYSQHDRVHSWLDVEFHSPTKFRECSKEGERYGQEQKSSPAKVTSAIIFGYVSIAQVPLGKEHPIASDVGKYDLPFLKYDLPFLKRNNHVAAAYVLRSLLHGLSLNDEKSKCDTLIRLGDDQFKQPAPLYIQVHNPTPARMNAATRDAAKVQKFLAKHEKRLQEAVQVVDCAQNIDTQIDTLTKNYDEVVKNYEFIKEGVPSIPPLQIKADDIANPLKEEQARQLNNADKLLEELYAQVPREILSHATTQGYSRRNDLIKRRLVAANECSREVMRGAMVEIRRRRSHGGDEW